MLLLKQDFFRMFLTVLLLFSLMIINSSHAVVPFYSEGEPGILPGMDPDSIPPVPDPPPPDEEPFPVAKIFSPTPDKWIKSSTSLVDKYPGQPANAGKRPRGALSGKFIYVNPGHGWMSSGSSWKTQRPAYNNIVEDHANADQVCFFMVQYLWNAGATVIPLRDIGPLSEMHIIDNDDPGFSISGTWLESTASPYWGQSGDEVHYIHTNTDSVESSVARWTPDFTKAGRYPVFVWYRDGSNRTTEAHYRIHHAGGITEVTLDQSKAGKGWIWLGNWYFKAGTQGYVEVSNFSSDTGKAVIADSARFGSGIHQGSGFPLYEMDGWWYADFSQADSSVTAASDVWSRPRLAAWINNAGIDDACYISFHSNGTTGIPETATARGAITLKNRDSWEGGPMPRAFEFSKDIIRQVDGDLLHFWGLPSRNDAVYTSSYGELTYNNINGEMAGTIVEVAFHDTPADSVLLKTAGFRRDSARAVLQGIVDYFADHGNPIDTYLPDSPGKVSAICDGTGGVNLSWSPPPHGEPGADAATGYYIYYSPDGKAWDNGMDVVNVTSYHYDNLTPKKEHYFRISAYNEGGHSFPSETVGVGLPPSGQSPRTLIVSGFRRYDNDIVAWGSDPKNGTTARVWPCLINSFNYVPVHGKAVASHKGFYFDSASAESVEEELVSLSEYTLVDWILGQEGVKDETFSPAEQGIVSDYLSGGGALFASGSEIAWDLSLNPWATSADRSFLNNSLHVDGSSDNGSDENIIRHSYTSMFYGIPGFYFTEDYENEIYGTLSPDALVKSGSGAVPSLIYQDTNLYAAIQYKSDSGSVVIFGFPFETINSEVTRKDVMERILFNLVGDPLPSIAPAGLFLY